MADASQLHADMVDYWNGVGADRWIAGQKIRDGMMQAFAEKALAAADAQPGERVIDIGCGCGETSVELAKAVGPAGTVLAADVSAPILAVAQDNLAPYPWASAAVADASTYAFEPASADLIFSRFGVMFFGDPTAAFTNIRKALKPGGRLVFACWRTSKENKWMSVPQEAIFQVVDRPPPADPDAPGPLSFASQERVTAILTAAGFSAPSFEAFDTALDISCGAGVEGAVRVSSETGAAARLTQDKPDDVKAKVAEALQSLFASLYKDNAIKLDAAVWIVSATAA